MALYQQALTWPSKPYLDCIPVADIPFTWVGGVKGMPRRITRVVGG